MATLIMPTEQERIPFYVGNPAEPETSILFYRRVPNGKWTEIVSRHTVLGHTNEELCILEFLDYAVVGWEKVLDYYGNAIPFHPDLKKHLPREACMGLYAKLRENAPTSFFDSLSAVGTTAKPLNSSPATIAENNTYSTVS